MSNSSSGRRRKPVATTPAPTFPSQDINPHHTLNDEDGYFTKQNFSDDTKKAIQQYLEPYAVPGSLYSPSQELNNSLRMGISLTQEQKTMSDGLHAGMHNLGENLNVTRYCRVDYMEDLGVSNFYRMNISTLKKRLVGKTYVDGAFLSVSYNNFSKAPAYNPFTDKALKLNIKAPASTKALMPGKGAGGDLGEFIFAPNQNYRITDVRFTGKKGRSGANYYKQVELDIEMF